MISPAIGFFVSATIAAMLLECVLFREDKKTKESIFSQSWLDVIHLVIAVIALSVSAWIFVSSSSVAVSSCAAGVVLGYFVWAILESAQGGRSFPRRKPALFVVIFLFASVFMLFADMYVGSTALGTEVVNGKPFVADGVQINKEVTIQTNGQWIATDQKAGLTEKFDAFFFSVSIFTTLGDEHFSVVGRRTQTIVLLELFTSFISLACVLSILISRLSSFASDGKTEPTPQTINIELKANESIISVGGKNFTITPSDASEPKTPTHPSPSSQD